MTRFSIRPYAPADAVACTRVLDLAWHAGHPYAPRKLDIAAFATERKGERVLVAETEANGIAGFVSLHEPGRFVHSLYVDPGLQGGGIGKALLARALALAGGPASLKCQTRNPAALAFYRGLGWREGESGESEFGPWVRMHSPD